MQRWQAPKQEVKFVSPPTSDSRGSCHPRMLPWSYSKCRPLRAMAPDTAAGRGPAFFPASDLLGPDTSLIYNDWYPALRSALLRGRKMARTMLLGIPLVLGRKEDGSIFAMRDSCPHRGIPLSFGWFDGST